MSKEIDTDILT